MIASTKRAVTAGGRTTAPVAYLTNIRLEPPLLPVGEEFVQKYTPEIVRKPFSTGVMGNPDIIEGDILVVGGVEYNVTWAGKVSEPVQYLKLIVDLVK